MAILILQITKGF